MKSKIELTDNFKPFGVNLTIESIQEARLLYHVFNERDIYYKISFIDNETSNINPYDFDVARSFNCDLYKQIEEEVKKQGFKI